MSLKALVALKEELKGFSISELSSLEKRDILLWCHDINETTPIKGCVFINNGFFE